MDWKTLFDEEEREIDRVLKEINNDPKFEDVVPPPDIREELSANIHEYQKQYKSDTLSDEEKELIRLGKCYKKRRKVERYVILVAAVVAMLAIGTVSIGENKNILTMLKQKLTGREQTVSDSGSTEPIKYIEENEMYEKIEEEYDFIPIRLIYRPAKTVFVEGFFGKEIQNISMAYEADNGTSILYVISPNYRESSVGSINEDEKIQEYTMSVNQASISVSEYLIEESGQNRWSIHFVYEDVQYWLRITNLEQSEVEKIINNLSFNFC